MLAPISSLGSPRTTGYSLYGESEAQPMINPGDVKTPRHLPPTEFTPTIGPSMPATRVYHYQNPVTGHAITSLLPPNHPEMVCLQEGRHIRKNKFGIIGIVSAVFWFPVGIGLCLLDRKVECERCRVTLSKSLWRQTQLI